MAEGGVPAASEDGTVDEGGFADVFGGGDPFVGDGCSGLVADGETVTVDCCSVTVVPGEGTGVAEVIGAEGATWDNACARNVVEGIKEGVPAHTYDAGFANMF